MGKIVIEKLVLDRDTVAELLRQAREDDHQMIDRYGSTAGYIINVVAQNADADSLRP